MAKKSFIVIFILCIGLIMIGCPKKTTVREEPSVKKEEAAKVEAERAKEAKEKFQEFVKTHPDAALSRDAEKNIEFLREKESESNYNIGRFYEKQKAYEAAKVYYNDIINNYSDSIWAARALERLHIMEGKKK